MSQYLHMPVRKPLEATQHPIKVVVRRTGLTADVLRAWERRYEAVAPGRSTTGRRLYSDEDIERLILLKRATKSGRSIGQVAAMSTVELSSMLDRDDVSTPVPRADFRTDPDTVRGHLTRCLRFVEQFDQPNLRAALRTAALTIPLTQLIENLLHPLLKTIGDRWSEGALGISQEHLATDTVESFLAEMMRVSGSPAASRIVVSTPSGQRHRIGSLLAAAMAVAAGWDVVYLGADLPAKDIAEAVSRTGALAVALSIINPVEDPDLRGELIRLRSLLPEDVALICGGAGTETYRDVLKQVGAERPPDFTTYLLFLDSLSAGSSGDPAA